jgi:hypothetical protein
MVDTEGQSPLNISARVPAPVVDSSDMWMDLCPGQIARGHRVGLIADSTTGGPYAEAKLAELAPRLALGVTRIAIEFATIGASDVRAVRQVSQRAATVGADVIHGPWRQRRCLCAACGAGPRAARLHPARRQPALQLAVLRPAFLYLAAERALMSHTDLFLFESTYGRDTFRTKIGSPAAPLRIVHNGVTISNFRA